MQVKLTPTPPYAAESGAAWSEFKHVEVTRTIENSKSTVHSWKLIRVPADQMETFRSMWSIIFARPIEDGKAHEVVIPASYVQWLFVWGYDACLNYDPMASTKEGILAHGVRAAKQMAHTRFLRHAVEQIRHGRNRVCKELYRDLARGKGLELERALLMHDILESDPPVRKLFAQYLVFLALNRQGSYDSYETLAILAKDQAELLQPFQKCRTDPFKTLTEGTVQIENLHELQMISLVRRLLELSGGSKDYRQHMIDHDYAVSDNLNLYTTLVGATGTNHFGSFDQEKMHNALLQSEVFGDSDIGVLDTHEWSKRVMDHLHIGFPEGHLNLPSQVLNGLSSKEVHRITTYFNNIYNGRPSLHKAENNTPLLLVWSTTTHSRSYQLLHKWASSEDGLNFRRRLSKDFRMSQAPEQLALILAALIRFARLLPQNSGDDAPRSTGCYLVDLDVLLSGKRLSNQGPVFERMGLSFQRVLLTFGKQFEDMNQLLANALDRKPPALESSDELLDQYGIERAQNKAPHRSAYKTLMKQFFERIDFQSDEAVETYCSSRSRQTMKALPRQFREEPPNFRDGPWTLVRFLAKSSLPKDFDLDEVLQDSGITIAMVPHIADRGLGFYELVVANPCLDRLSVFPYFEISRDRDPFEPAEWEVLVYGTWEAKERAQIDTLNNAAEAIRESWGNGPVECYSSAIGKAGLETELEVAVLYWDIQHSDFGTLKSFTENLLYFALRCCDSYDSSTAFEIRERDQNDWLQFFCTGRTDISRRLAVADCPDMSRNVVVQQTISLFRRLLSMSGGKVDSIREKLDMNYTTSENAIFCANFLDIPCHRQFEHFNQDEMKRALSESKLFTQESNIPDTLAWGLRMIQHVPFGFPAPGTV